MLPKDAKEWATKVRDLTGKDIAFLISTDHHFDHVMGNAFLTERVVCHSTAARGIKFLRNKEALKQMVRNSFPDIVEGMEADIERLDIIDPMITFKDNLMLNMGDVNIKIEFVGGHSPGTVLIHLVEDKVVFTGDNVEEYFPYIGQGQIKKWLSILVKMLEMDVDTFVPGHGAVGGKKMVENYISFFRNLEIEVHDFNKTNIAVNAMAQKTKLVDYFPFPQLEPAKVLYRREWNREQYVIAAKQILQYEKH